jgi:predicted transcriptional regulator of viral defense system
VWVTNEKIQISNPSQTIVDILNDPLVGGGIRHCVEIVQNYFNSEHRNTTELLECIKEVKNKTIFKRLGYILESLNIEVDDFINTCKNNISAGYSALDPTIKNKGTFNRKWNLRINADIKK